MENSSGKVFRLTLNGVSLEALETSQFLDVAIQLIRARKFELERDDSSLFPLSKKAEKAEEDILPHGGKLPHPTHRDEFSGVKKSSQGRWFRDRFLKVRFGDGNVSVLRSLDELKTFIGQRGLTPHPRGDASMLIWQLRNRLGLEATPITPDD